MKYTVSLRQAKIAVLCAAVLCAVPVCMARAQDPAGAAAAAAMAAELTVEAVQGRMDRLKENATLDEAAKTRGTEFYATAIEQLTAAKERRAKAAVFEAERVGAPEQIQQIGAELAAPVGEAPPEVPENATANEINLLLLQVETELAEAVRQRDALATEPTRRADRRAQIPQLLAAATARIEEARDQLALPSDAAQALEVTEARRTATRARIQAAAAEKDLLDKEMRSYEARTQLLTLRQDQSERSVTNLQRRAEQLRSMVAAAREQEAAAAAVHANLVSTRIGALPAELQEIARQVADAGAELVQERSGENGILGQIQAAQELLRKLEAQAATVTADFNAIDQKARAQQALDVWGATLREYRRRLRGYLAYPTDVAGHRKSIASAQYTQYELQQERRGFADINGLVAQALATVPEDAEGIDGSEVPALGELLRVLYTTQRASLDALISDYDTYVDLLLRLQVEEQKYNALTATFRDYIAERILWIRSAEPLNRYHLRDVPGGALWCVNPENWLSVFRALRRDALDSAWTNAGFLIGLAAVVFLRRRWVSQMKESAGQAMKSSATDFSLTFKTFLSAMGVALIVPGVLGFLVWRLRVSSYSEGFIHGVSSGIGHVALLLITYECCRQVLRKSGLGEAHFAWSSGTVRAVRQTLLRYVPLILVSAFFFSLCEWSSEPQVNDGLGRVAFLVAMLTSGFLAHRLMRPTGGPLAQLLSRHMGKHNKPIYLLYLLVLAVPIALAILAIIGYHYTAMRLAWRVHGTILFAFGALVIHGMFSRWLLTARRKLAKEHAQQRRETLKQQAKDGEVPKDKFEAEELDLAKIDARTQSLLRGFAVLGFLAGLWFVWGDVMPALRALDKVEFWQTTRMVTQSVTENDITTQETIEVLEPVTLIHFGKALLVVIVTWMLVRNLPDLLELALLRKLPLAAGERYAIQAVMGYCIAAVGIVLVPSVLGLGWSKLQWLVASLGVGLGFGLQEIFANFVSGLIILFERPMRVGDTVTIGGVSGQVTRIRIRATRIVDWDRKELIVPNKEFVTGQLINWSLSDTTIRLTIPVGIAYGSDTEKAIRVLLETAKAHPLIMDDPEPDVIFQAFGESTLDLELRVFCPTLDTRIRIKHQLHLDIDAAFREAGIEIAFPQRDVHLYQMPTPTPKEAPSSPDEAPPELS